MNDTLTKLAGQLKHSFDAQDWESLAGIDVLVRQELERLTTELSELAPSDKKRAAATTELEGFLKRYERIYTLMVKGAEKHRAEIVSELKQVTRENKVAKTYLDSSTYR